jgi:hypothetical protein
MSIEWVEYKGKKILYIEYKNLSPEQMLNQIKEATKILVATNSKENLTLTDMTGSFVNDEFLELAKEQGKISLSVTKKAAIVGVTGIKKLLLNVVNTVSPLSRKPFDNIDDAKEWLIE